MPTVRSPRPTQARPTHCAEILERRTHFAAASAFPATYGSAVGFDNAQKIVTLTDGGYIVAGLFSGTVNFGGAGKSGVRTARGDTDIYVARYQADNSLAWVQTIGGDATDRAMSQFKRRDLPINPRRIFETIGKVGDQPRAAGEYVNDMAVDNEGNVYLVGAFRQQISVGHITLTADQTYDKDFYDALIVKFSGEGNVTWARQIGGAYDDAALAVAVDRTGTPIIGGFYGRSADFDPSSRVYRLESPDGRNAGFVARLTATGGLAWAYHFTSKAVGSAERNVVNDLAVTANGEVYFTGTFAYRADFDPSPARYELESAGRTDAFVAHLSRKGQFRWAIPVGGDEEDGFNNIALDNEGNIYTAGYFSDEVDVDPRRNVTNIFKATAKDDGDNPEFTDILVSKWAPDGRPIWQAQMGGAFYETVSDLQIGPDGSVYTVGAFFGTADFAPGRSKVLLTSVNTRPEDGSIRDNNTRFGRHETYDWYVVRLSPRNGSYVNAARFGGQDDDFASTLAVRSNGRLLVGGRATTARGDRDDRQEQALIYELTANLA